MFIGTSILDSSKQHMYRFFFSMTLRSLNMEIILEWYLLTLTALYFVLALAIYIYIYIYEDLKEISDEMDFSG